MSDLDATAPSHGRILRADELAPVPWRNGHGVTREIVLFPPGADTDDFLWRASVADVVGPAPFSSFPGIDRIIVLLAGEGFHMTLNDTRQHALTTPFAPFAFAGDARVTVRLAGGPTHDFNLMLRRGRIAGDVEVWRDAGTRRCPDDLALLYAASGHLDTPDGLLDTGDSWLPDHPASGDVVLAAGTAALAVRIRGNG